MSLTTTVLNPQLSLFVVFEKKVGLIRIVNSAVGEVVLFEEPATYSSRDSFAASSSSSLSPTGFASLSGRRSRTSLDGFGLAKDNRGAWTLPAKLDLPTGSISSPSTSAGGGGGGGSGGGTASSASSPGSPEDTMQPPQSIYIVTRGKQSFALPCPLPANLQLTPPLQTFSWRSPPTFVTARVIDLDYGGTGGRWGGGGGSEFSHGSSPATPATVPTRVRVLQLTAFNEDGLEILETPLSSLVFGSGKERARAAEEPVVAEVVIGDTGFLCDGGHWHRPYDAPLDLTRSQSVRSAMSFDSMATADIISRLESDQGTYGWQRKGMEDWRVFWIGGTGEEQRTDDD
jgi:hypothetical protein